MTHSELLEKLSYFEHESWSNWMKYLFSICKDNIATDGTMTIPASSVAHWMRQMNTPYTELTEREKESDRDEVRKILPTIYEFANDKT